MKRKIRSLFGRVKSNFTRRPRPRSTQEENAHLRRRMAVLAQENMELAGYVRFLTDKCVVFEIGQLVRQVEKGEVLV